MPSPRPYVGSKEAAGVRFDRYELHCSDSFGDNVMPEPFSGIQVSAPSRGMYSTGSDPITRAAVVSPSDSTDLSVFCRGFMVGTAGNVKVTTTGGDTVILYSVVAGVIHGVQCSRIWSTGTTAASITAVW